MGAKAHHDPAYRRLCRRLRDWRTSAGLTQRALAERLRRPHSYIYKVESQNRRIDPIELSRWAMACGVKPEEVIAAIGLRSAR